MHKRIVILGDHFLEQKYLCLEWALMVLYLDANQLKLLAIMSGW